MEGAQDAQGDAGNGGGRLSDECMISEAVLMDNMEYMARFPDKFFHIAIVDPPYGINSANMQMGHNPVRSRNDGHGSGPGESVAV